MEFAEHKDLLLTEKKTKDDFMFDLPSVTKLLSKKKRIALEDKKNTILSKITNFTNRMLGRIVPTGGGKKTRGRRGKIEGKRTKKYRGGVDKKRGRKNDNNGPTKRRMTRINVNIQSTPRDIELLFRILGLFVFFLTFLRDKIKNEKTKTFCSIRIDKINNFVKELYITHFDRLLTVFPNINLKNMFQYGNRLPTDNNIYKYNPNDVLNNYEQLINKSSQDNGDLFNKINTSFENKIAYLFENKIAYLFAQYIPFFIYNNNIVSNAFEEEYQYDIFEMLYENTMTSVIMYIIGTYVGDIGDGSDQYLKINYFDKKHDHISSIITLDPVENTNDILGFLPAILNDQYERVRIYLDAFLEKIPISDTLPNINTSSLNQTIFVKQPIQDVTSNIMENPVFKSYKDTPYPNNPEIELLLNNIKQKLPSIIKTGFEKPDFIFNVPVVGKQTIFEKIIGTGGGYKSSRKNKKYRKQRKYRYR
jgi:hypothetical protein